MTAASSDDELERIRRNVGNLNEVLALPEAWRGRSAGHILGSLGDALLRLLDLSFVFARLDPAAGLGNQEVFRSDTKREPLLQQRSLDPILTRWIAEEQSAASGVAANPLDGGLLGLASLHFGLHNRLGTLVTGSSRADYPTVVEMLLLRVAVSQASVALSEESQSQLRRHAAVRPEGGVANGTERLLEATSELRRLHDDLTAELGAMAGLHELSARLQAAGELPSVLDQVLAAIMDLQLADFGDVRLDDPERGDLLIVAQRNFPPELLERYTATRGDDWPSARAASLRKRVIVEDVQADDRFASLWPFASAAGFRAIQATPLIGHRGDLLGVLSTHFRKPHQPSEFELRLTDFYSNFATQTIERKHAEVERSKLASIVENSADFIGIASLGGKALFLNPAGRWMVGLAEDEPLLSDVRSYLAPADGERLVNEIMPTVERVGYWDGEMCLRHSHTGACIPVLQHVFFINDPQTGRRLALATVCRDITERRRAERVASDAQQELARASRLLSLGELSSSIAHEVNQPLGAIIANGSAGLRWINREVPDLSEARGALERIIRDAHRASEVILRIRAFSTRTTLSRSPLGINEVIREVLALTRDEVQRDRVVLSTQLADDLPAVLADRVELQQVVLNLILNAVEAMRSVADRPRVLSISSLGKGSCAVEVSVSDSGNGVTPQDAARLFEPLFTTKPGGMGLGLSISRRIIEMHGGQLFAVPNRDSGLTLQFSLPAYGKMSTPVALNPP